MPDNINEPKSDILDALQGSYSPPQGNIQEPKSPILQVILDGSGGSGGSYDDTEIKQRLACVEEWIDTLKTFTYSVVIDNIEVPAAVNGVGGRVNVQGDIIDLPDGYEVKALRSYSVQRATGAASGDQSWKQANFNMIGTTGGGKKGNLGILNSSSEPIFVKVLLEYNCGKVYPQAGA